MEEKILNAYSQPIELTEEQKACLKYSGDRTLLIKGLAGSGKSVVLSAITQKLVEANRTDPANKIALFTYQNTLVSTTREILQANGAGSEAVMVSTVDSYVKSIYEELVLQRKAPRVKYPYSPSRKQDDIKKIRLQNVEKALNAHKTKFGNHRFHKVGAEFWLEEFDWMKSMNVWKNDLEYYLALPRKGRGGKVRMSAADRISAYQIYSCYCEQLEKTGQGDWADQTLFLVRNHQMIPASRKYQNVLVDEAQDLSLAQMFFLMRIYQKDMVVAMDMNQKIHDNSWTPKLIGISTTTKKLTKSMRTTKEIDALAESVRSKNDALLDEDDKSIRAIPEKNGPIPKVVRLESPAAEQKYVVESIKELLKSYPEANIGLIAPTKRQIRVYSDWMASAGIYHEIVSKDNTFSVIKPGVKIVTSYSAKGLEFNAVIIPCFREGNFPYWKPFTDEEEEQQFIIKMRNIVYVSMTRAKKILLITFAGDNGSRFVSEMDLSCYEGVGDPVTHAREADEPYKAPSAPETDHEEVNESQNGSDALIRFLEDKGIKVIDNRNRTGYVWAVGGEEIMPILDEATEKFMSLWTYSRSGFIGTRFRPAWKTKISR